MNSPFIKQKKKVDKFWKAKKNNWQKFLLIKVDECKIFWGKFYIIYVRIFFVSTDEMEILGLLIQKFWKTFFHFKKYNFNFFLKTWRRLGSVGGFKANFKMLRVNSTIKALNSIDIFQHFPRLKVSSILKTSKTPLIMSHAWFLLKLQIEFLFFDQTRINNKARKVLNVFFFLFSSSRYSPHTK